jgi:hypothetical protein
MYAKDLRDNFFKFENESQAFEQKVCGNVHYWDIIRQSLFEALLGHYNLYQFTPVVPERKSALKTKAQLFFKMVENELIFFFRRQKRTFLFVSLSRNLDQGGWAKDELNTDYKRVLPNSSYLELETWSQAHFPRELRYKNRQFIYRLLFQKKFKFFVNKKRFKPIDEFVDRFECFFGLVNVINRNDVENLVYSYLTEVQYYRSILKKVKPACVISSMHEKSIAHACRSLDITSVELQHGSISSLFNLIYNYGGHSVSEMIPSSYKFLFTFSEYWAKLVRSPTIPLPMGNSYLFKPTKENKNTSSSLLIITNQDFTEMFMSEMKVIASEFKEVTFHFKLHSAEFEYEERVRKFFKGDDNVNVIYNEKTVSELMEICQVVFTIQTTATYQALQQNLKVIILRKKYYWISDDVLELPNVFLIDNWDEFRSLLKSQHLFAKRVVETQMFFDPFHVDQFREFSLPFLK